MSSLRSSKAPFGSLARVRAGLRLQILVLLGGLMFVAFTPLYAALATYTRVALEQLRASHARSLGRVIGAHVAEVGQNQSPQALETLLGSQVGSEGIEAIRVYHPSGAVLGSVGAAEWFKVPMDVSRERALEVTSGHGRALAVVVPSTNVSVLAIVRLEPQRAEPLLRLFSLYTTLVALSLLLLTYFALTRFIVKPLSELSHAAQRVAQGARQLATPKTSAHELHLLGHSLHAMTRRLLDEEEALRKKVDELEASQRRLTEAQQSLIASERLASVGRLAAGLAHEVGNPLAALIGLQDLLLEGGLDASEQQDFLQRMRRETERIHRILRDLLDFARTGADLTREAGEPGDVYAAIHDTEALIFPQKQLQSIAWHTELERDLPRVKLSRERLVQVLLNLLLNAGDAVKPGGNVRLSARRQKDRVELCVEDDGPGVAPEVAARLFEPFVTTKEPGKGTGLGLAVCRGLLEAVGGSIRYDIDHGPGARFVVSLPAVID
ncbi:MAG TPA: HAMP domain-containing sensor histidine kinase [Polyangiaceae bacterium]|nr:HAMP domain-containing sensor histidine kinase [Polyangiaceae bacterium]